MNNLAGLDAFGFTPAMRAAAQARGAAQEIPARVTAVHKERYALVTDDQTWADFGGYVAPFKWLRFYANLRNAFNAQNIVGRRPYGARVNAPRWLQVGLKAEF